MVDDLRVAVNLAQELVIADGGQPPVVNHEDGRPKPVGVRMARRSRAVRILLLPGAREKTSRRREDAKASTWATCLRPSGTAGAGATTRDAGRDVLLVAVLVGAERGAPSCARRPEGGGRMIC
ncbi:MAG: hypothetical protein ACJ74F_20440 [Mycobacterium sp.]|uniref:hypothetical protein n=1 Tax=Mycobacterium sp. TaxID=1785 RepID=UPI00389B0DD3